MPFIIDALHSAHQTAGVRYTGAGMVYFVSCSSFWVLGSVCGAGYVQMCCVRSSGCPSGLMRFTVPIRPEVPDTHVRWCTFCLVLFWVLGCVFEASCVPMCCAGLVYLYLPLGSGFWAAFVRWDV